ncbi:hypothetical protein CMI47_04490 [Candidatus Pacearchaeota archaeon]|jgi:RimJ/RimL family protein N-acetyltransferase|nr:hypothetical protein [Candidatus Pacearchaeota archaeon]|tara:strand:+ start:11814 stop:12245 length:432 start_codon:yes stop_codon:yes gene_type:complete
MLINNPELAQAILCEVYEQVAEDNAPHPSTLDLTGIPVIALRGDEGVHGIMMMQPFGFNSTIVGVAIRPDYYGHKENIELVRRGVAQCAEITNAPKFLMAIPTEDKSTLRLAQQVGFKREGVIRNSFLRNGKMIDQYLVGISV